MKTRLCLVVCAAIAVSVPGAMSASDEPDALIGGKIVVVKTAKLAKFVAKPPKGQEFVLPSASNDPTVEGATLRIFDVGGDAGDVTYSLPAGSWKGLGKPAGAKGFKYKGAGCKTVLVKPKVIKAVCKENVQLTTPFAGTVGIVLTVGTDSKRYCVEFGGEQKKNDTKLTKRKNAPPPAQCPEPQVPSTATATATGVPTGTAATATPTGTAAATITATATLPPDATATATATGTAAATITATGTPTGTAATIIPTPTPTATPPVSTPTDTPGIVCPLSPGSYTVTQVAGGTLQVYTFAPFPFPAGGSIVQDVAAGDASCTHDTVVPFPGGFSAPTFCVPALGLTVLVEQTGCGIGRMDSDGGSDFTINELGDTSDNSATCNLPHPGCPPGPPVNGANASIRVDVTVGNGAADTCASGGTANALVSIPVHTTSWSESGPGGCGTGTPDTEPIVAEFDQILDFTTDTASGGFMDIDGDGCSAAGPIPGGPFSDTGVCIDIPGGTVTTVATGQFGSTGGTFDGAFTTKLPNTITGPDPPLGATCPSPPVINYTGLATRCIP